MGAEGGWGEASVKMTGGASPTRETGEALFRASHCLDRVDFNLVEGCVRMAHWERKLFVCLFVFSSHCY